MIIIYHCFGGTHSSVLAAAIHTRKLPIDRIPENSEIINLPYYDKNPEETIGTLFYFGQDEWGNKVFILGMGKAEGIIKNFFYSFIKIEGIATESIHLENTLKYINPYVRIGGFLSRKLGLIFPGRLLTVYGLKKAYPKFVKLVRKVKEQIVLA